MNLRHLSIFLSWTIICVLPAYAGIIYQTTFDTDTTDVPGVYAPLEFNPQGHEHHEAINEATPTDATAFTQDGVLHIAHGSGNAFTRPELTLSSQALFGTVAFPSTFTISAEVGGTPGRPRWWGSMFKFDDRNHGDIAYGFHPGYNGSNFGLDVAGANQWTAATNGVNSRFDTLYPMSITVTDLGGSYRFDLSVTDPSTGNVSSDSKIASYPYPITTIGIGRWGDSGGDAIFDNLVISSPASTINDGLVAYYPFNGNANDESGNGNDGTVNGATLTTDRNGTANRAYSFDGNDSIGSTDIITLSSHTYSVWVNTTDNRRVGIISSDDSGGKFGQILMEPTGEFTVEVTLAVGVCKCYKSTSTINDGQWHLISYTFDAPSQSLKLYLDGVEQSVTKVNDRNISGFNFTEEFRIGIDRDEIANMHFNGKIDDVRIYNRALSEEEVSELYDLERPATTGSTFEIVQGTFTWEEARADAEAQGGRLAVLNTSEVLATATPIINSFPGSLWIGLSDKAQEGEWMWITGEPLTFANWELGQPDNNTATEDYAHIFWSSRDSLRRWNDSEVNDNNVGTGNGNLNNDKGYLLERPASTLTDGLVAYYPFNGNADDESGNSLHGVPTDTILTPDRNGVPDSAYQFQPHVDSQIRVADDPLLNFDDQFTVSYWAKFDETWTFHQESLVYKFDLGSLRGWHFGVNQDDAQNGAQKYRYALQVNEGGRPIPSAFEIVDFATISGWHHVTGVLRDSTIEFYLDGVLVASSSGPANVPNVANDLIIGGAVHPVSGAYQRNLDDVRIYNRALSEEEVAALYELEKPTTTESTFEIVEGSFSWHEARVDAEARGGRLAVLNTQEKIDEANTFLNSIGSWPILWLGLTDEVTEGDWRWITGEAITAHNWRGGEPSNAWDSEHFAHLWHSSFRSPLQWNDLPSDSGRSLEGSTTGSYLLEIIPEPAPPGLEIAAYLESNPGEPFTVDATPISGYPTDFTYQWHLDGVAVPAAFGGTGSSVTFAGALTDEGSWRVVVTNAEGSTEATFDYRVFVDTDDDGLSDAYEALFSLTDPFDFDTDRDGLNDGSEVLELGTDPLLADTDGDGFDDYYELRNRFDPISPASTPESVATVFPTGELQFIEFRFNTAKGIRYRVESSTNLTDWATEEAGINGRGGAVYRYFSTENRPQAFFRARRE